MVPTCERFETCYRYDKNVCCGAYFILNRNYNCGLTGTPLEIKMIDPTNKHGINPKEILARAFPGVPRR